MPINFKAYPEPYGWTEFVINGYVYRTNDKYWADEIIHKAVHRPGKAWNAVQKYCKYPTNEVINGKQVMSSMPAVETSDMHDRAEGC